LRLASCMGGLLAFDGIHSASGVGRRQHVNLMQISYHTSSPA